MVSLKRQPLQRARRAEHKEARSNDLLDAALDLYRERGFSGFTLADVAGRTGLAKGTLFLYFPTREALGLGLVERLLGAFLDDLDAKLGRLRAPTSPSRMARQFAEACADHPDLVGLLAILGTLLEHNIEEATALRFKRWLVGRMVLTGALLEKALPYLPQGGGARLLMQLHALVVGLHLQLPTSPVMARVLASPGMEPLRIDLVQELQFSARALIEGLRAQRLQGGAPG